MRQALEAAEAERDRLREASEPFADMGQWLNTMKKIHGDDAVLMQITASVRERGTGKHIGGTQVPPEAALVARAALTKSEEV